MEAVLYANEFHPVLKLFEAVSDSGKKKHPKGVIGYLYGPVANYRKPTLNYIFYNEDYWDELMSSSKFKRFLRQKKYIGELSHPLDSEDRVETELTEGCVILIDLEKKPDGFIYGKFLILDNEEGWKTRTYFEVGCELGVSFRGSGQTASGRDGIDTVIPGSSDFKGFDVVRDPAVEESVLKLLESRRDERGKLGLKLTEDTEISRRTENMVETMFEDSDDYQPGNLEKNTAKTIEQVAENVWNEVNQNIAEDFSYYIVSNQPDIVIFLKGHKNDPDYCFAVNCKSTFSKPDLDSIATSILQKAEQATAETEKDEEILGEAKLTESVSAINNRNKVHETNVVIDPELYGSKAYVNLEDFEKADLLGQDIYQCPICLSKLLIRDIDDYIIEDKEAETDDEQSIVECPECHQASVLSNEYDSFICLGKLFTQKADEEKNKAQ